MMHDGTKWLLPIVAVIGLSAEVSSKQSAVAPVNDLPNPYEAVRNWGTLPDGRTWGSTGAINIDRDGASIWAVERCGSHSWQAAGGSCAGSNLPAVLKFDASGKLVRAIGGGVFIFPHGLHVDGDGNVWVVDSRGAAGSTAACHLTARSGPAGDHDPGRGTHGTRGLAGAREFFPSTALERTAGVLHTALVVTGSRHQQQKGAARFSSPAPVREREP